MVKEDLKTVDIKLTFEQIKELKRDTFKKLVKAKVKSTALEDLLRTKNLHSKMKNLHYSDLQLQGYLKSSSIHCNQARDIFKFSTRCSNVRSNFKSKYTNTGLQCPLLGCDEREDDPHLINCKITEDYRRLLGLEICPDYQKLFNGTVEERGQVTSYLKEAMEIRDCILEKQDILN
jgi:hypothetical protein